MLRSEPFLSRAGMNLNQTWFLSEGCKQLWNL